MWCCLLQLCSPQLVPPGLRGHPPLQSDGFPPLPTLAATHALSGEIPSPLLRFLVAVNKDRELLPSAFIDAETQVLGFVTYQVFFLNSLFSQQFQSP